MAIVPVTLISPCPLDPLLLKRLKPMERVLCGNSRLGIILEGAKGEICPYFSISAFRAGLERTVCETTTGLEGIFSATKPDRRSAQSGANFSPLNSLLTGKFTENSRFSALRIGTLSSLICTFCCRNLCNLPKSDQGPNREGSGNRASIPVLEEGIPWIDREATGGNPNCRRCSVQLRGIFLLSLANVSCHRRRS